jgi:chromosome segregation ATPase
MVETGTIAMSIQETILPALSKINAELKHLDTSQAELSKTLERINAEGQVFKGLIEAPQPALESLEHLNSLRKRITRIHRKLELISSRLTQL